MKKYAILGLLAFAVFSAVRFHLKDAWPGLFGCRSCTQERFWPGVRDRRQQPVGGWYWLDGSHPGQTVTRLPPPPPTLESTQNAGTVPLFR